MCAERGENSPARRRCLNFVQSAGYLYRYGHQAGQIWTKLGAFRAFFCGFSYKFRENMCGNCGACGTLREIRVESAFPGAEDPENGCFLVLPLAQRASF